MGRDFVGRTDGDRGIQPRRRGNSRTLAHQPSERLQTRKNPTYCFSTHVSTA